MHGALEAADEQLPTAAAAAATTTIDNNRNGEKEKTKKSTQDVMNFYILLSRYRSAGQPEHAADAVGDLLRGAHGLCLARMPHINVASEVTGGQQVAVGREAAEINTNERGERKKKRKKEEGEK